MKLIWCAGKYPYTVTVNVITTTGINEKLKLTIFCDSRDDAIKAASYEAIARGYTKATVDHITKVG